MYLDLTRELTETIEHESDGDTIVIGTFSTVTKKWDKNWRTSALLRSVRILRRVSDT